MTRTWAMLAAAAMVGPASAAAQAPGRPPANPAPVVPEGAHDFDFEFGSWTVRIARRLKPLTGSTEWVEYQGSSVVRPWWGGAANVGELNVSGPAGRIEGMSVRLYDPASRQWKIHWANRSDGALGAPMVGGFAKGRGLFYNSETLGGRAILVRFIFSGISRQSFRIEQAFSADGGTTWETNWISDFRKVAD